MLYSNITLSLMYMHTCLDLVCNSIMSTDPTYIHVCKEGEKINQHNLKMSQGVIKRVLDMDLTPGSSCSSPEAIFNQRNEVLEGYNMPPAHPCRGDNASVMLGKGEWPRTKIHSSTCRTVPAALCTIMLMFSGLCAQRK